MPSRRDQIAMTEDEVRAFLVEQRIMQCATVGPRGVPHLMPLWYVPETGTELIAWTYAKSQKARNLERDARATVAVEDGVSYDELRGVTLECAVELEREPRQVERYGLRLFERYAGELTPEIQELVARQAQKRVGMRFVPRRAVSWDHRKLGGAY